MKEYKVTICREYITNIILKFPDDGRNHAEIIDDKIHQGDEEIWDLIAEKELEQMDISNEQWDIEEIDNTRTGALHPDTGAAERKPPISEWTMHTKYDKK